MLVGKFPQKEFLQKYDLEAEYWGITDSCNKGDIKSFEKHMNSNM